ncbi:hypothetical protein BRADO0466 [Bradyrhizobium sp. ORS 278]|uniref:hypothetical protein n=1 Tax=Bradyrhizobium sp. (strain ORS 278) TaxID=114615 RepID=UPI00015077BD|nr:hypothetical protein [Bradyrhizobium sp. ORS 278]CAL74410.1 hypothetical protein BRADO0466 [Bradyrhizobium sp. ORS 278]
MMLASDIQQLAIGVAVSLADAPFAELEAQSTQLAEMALEGFLTKQQASDIAFTAAKAAGLVHRHGPDVVQETISEGFNMAVLAPIEAPPIVPKIPAKRPYQTPESTIAAFWYTVHNEDEATLRQWLLDHPADAPYLRKLWEARCCKSK